MLDPINKNTLKCKWNDIFSCICQTARSSNMNKIWNKKVKQEHVMETENFLSNKLILKQFAIYTLFQEGVRPHKAQNRYVSNSNTPCCLLVTTNRVETVRNS